MLRLLAILLFLPSALAAQSCERNFRAGLEAYANADRALRRVEEVLYSGLGWVTREAVLARLEGRSALTSRCQEVQALQQQLAGALQLTDAADQRFRLASAICLGVNRSRAEANLEALTDTAGAIATQATYLRILAERC